MLSPPFCLVFSFFPMGNIDYGEWMNKEKLMARPVEFLFLAYFCIFLHIFDLTGCRSSAGICPRARNGAFRSAWRRKCLAAYII